MHLAKNERGLDLKTKGSQLGNVENIATGEKMGPGLCGWTRDCHLLRDGIDCWVLSMFIMSVRANLQHHIQYTY